MSDISARANKAFRVFLEDKQKLLVFEDVIMNCVNGKATEQDVIIAYNKYRSVEDSEESINDE